MTEVLSRAKGVTGSVHTSAPKFGSDVQWRAGQENSTEKKKGHGMGWVMKEAGIGLLDAIGIITMSAIIIAGIVYIVRLKMDIW